MGGHVGVDSVQSVTIRTRSGTRGASLSRLGVRSSLEVEKLLKVKKRTLWPS